MADIWSEQGWLKDNWRLSFNRWVCRLTWADW